MSQQQNEVILGCNGGKCPIKILCVTYLRKDSTTKINPPFVQIGMQIKCSYLKLTEHERSISKAVTEPQIEQQEKSIDENKAFGGEEKRTVQAVAASQKQLFE